MNQRPEQHFTKYEVARIIGARALQIAMDAPLLLKISEDRLKELKFDALLLAQEEFDAGVLPISITRPTPKRKKDKISPVKEDKVTDEDLIAKEKEVEKEFKENPTEFSLVEEEETTEVESTGTGSEEQ